MQVGENSCNWRQLTLLSDTHLRFSNVSLFYENVPILPNKWKNAVARSVIVTKGIQRTWMCILGAFSPYNLWNALHTQAIWQNKFMNSLINININIISLVIWDKAYIKKRKRKKSSPKLCCILCNTNLTKSTVYFHVFSSKANSECPLKT